MATKRKDVEQTQEQPVNQAIEAPTSPQDVPNPDMVLLDQYNAAKAVIGRFDARLADICAYLRARDVQYSEEDIAGVKTTFDNWLKGKYPGIAYRVIRQEIDMDAWNPNHIGDEQHIHPTIEALAREKMVGMYSMTLPSKTELAKSALAYIKSAVDEEGAPILSTEFDIPQLENIFGLTEKRKVSTGEGGKRGPRDTSGNKSADAVWPGTDVKFKVSYMASTNKYYVWAAGTPKLIDSLKAKGITITKEAIQTWVDNNHQNLTFS